MGVHQNVVLVIKNLTVSAGDTRDAGSIPGSGRSLGEGNGNPLQYSCLENSMGRGAWWDTVHGVTKSRAEHFSLHIRKFKGERKIETRCEFRGGHGIFMQICATDSWKHNSESAEVSRIYIRNMNTGGKDN